MNFLNFDINRILISIVPFMLAIMVHEVCHGYAAYLLGDNTAKNAGRLTLNPLAHLDILGLLCLITTQMFGWAKPVPVNFNTVSRKKYGPLMVAAAGPAANFCLAAISLVLMYGFVHGIGFGELQHKLEHLSYKFIFMSLNFSIMINITLGIFNLIPILPLDGGRILHNLLPQDKAYAFSKTERWGFFIILILIFTGVIHKTVFPIIRMVHEAMFSLVFSGFVY